MADVLVDPGKLRSCLQELLRLRKSGETDPELTPALAECCFRLAVAAETPLTESLDLLHLAVRCDGVNPKYAYHLARLLLQHGKLDHAASWIMLASRLCPTSHRIWCHISLLQKELDQVYAGNPRFEPQALRNRGELIARAIREGKDDIDPILFDFTPPPSKKMGEDGRQQNETETAATAANESVVGMTRKRLLRVRRLIQPGKCRWSGIRDLLAEELLGQVPSKRNLKQITPVLEDLTNAATANHPGARSRFAILAIEWILSGYPVARIRRLRAGLDASTDHPSLRLLDLVCDLYDMPTASLPDMIATSLHAGRIPHLLAALIHQRRLLWRSMAFPKIGTYRAACRLLMRATQGQPNEEDGSGDQASTARDYSRNLNLGIQQLMAERPSAFEDTALDQSGPLISDRASADTCLTQLEDAACALIKLSDAAFDLLKNGIEPRVLQVADDAAWSQVVTDRSAVDEITDALMKAGTAGKAGVDRIINIVTSLGDTARPDQFSERQEQCGKQFGKLMMPGLFTKPLKRIDKALGTISERFKTMPATRSEAITHVLTKIREAAGPLLSGESQLDVALEEPDSSQSTAADDVAEFADPVDPSIIADEPAGESTDIADTDRPAYLRELRRTVEAVDRCITEIFEEANSTFEVYTAAQKALPSIQAIRMLIHARQADMLYRLGHRTEARRVWTGILREDRTNSNVLKNIAVCDSSGVDIARSLSSWRSYIEILYFYDIISGSPRPYAGIRSQFHRAVGNAYAPAFLFKELDNTWLDNVDNIALFSFLASPGRLRNFISHKMLEFANRRLGFTSPPLILGVSRSDGEQIRSAAKESLETFCQQVFDLLPERVRSAFIGVTERHIRQAFEACASAKRLTARKDQHYAEEEKTQLQFLKDFVDLKYKLVIAIQKNNDLVKHMETVHFLDELARLDQIPIGQSDSMLRSVAGARGLTPESAAGLMSNELRGRLITNLLELIFSEGDASDQSIRTRQYRRLVQQWVTLPSFAEYLDFIDDPQHFYPEVVKAAFMDHDSSQQTVEILYGWHQRFPELTGPVRLLAQLLYSRKQFTEAIRVLTEACDKGFYRKRVVTCCFHRMICWYHRSETLSDKTEVRHSLEQALKDAHLIIAESGDHEEVERAREVQEHVRKLLGG